MTYSYQYIHNQPGNPFINIYYQDKYVHILSNDITADNVLQVYHILISLGNNEIRLQVKLAELYEIAKSEGYEKINFDRTSYHDLDRIALTKDKCARFIIALVKCKGELTSSIVWGNDTMQDRSRSMNCRIKLPHDKRELFETLSGLTLHEIEAVVGN
jgi:hypothetical protein